MFLKKKKKSMVSVDYLITVCMVYMYIKQDCIEGSGFAMFSFGGGVLFKRHCKMKLLWNIFLKKFLQLSRRKCYKKDDHLNRINRIPFCSDWTSGRAILNKTCTSLF